MQGASHWCHGSDALTVSISHRRTSAYASAKYSTKAPQTCMLQTRSCVPQLALGSVFTSALQSSGVLLSHAASPSAGLARCRRADKAHHFVWRLTTPRSIYKMTADDDLP